MATNEKERPLEVKEAGKTKGLFTAEEIGQENAAKKPTYTEEEAFAQLANQQNVKIRDSEGVVTSGVVLNEEEEMKRLNEERVKLWFRGVA